jgi:phage terminase large subunit-like protein
VAALYEQGRVIHCGDFPELAEELMALGADETRRSPDRADALVWALSDLLLKRPGRPRVWVA